MDVVSAGLNDAHSGRLLGFYLMTYGEGTLDKEESNLLGLGLEIRR